MKNAYVNKLRQAKSDAYKDGVVGGMKMGFDLVAIALNHEFGFGNERLKRLEEKVQELVNDVVDTNDPIVTKAHLRMALKQIRGEEWELG